MSDTSYNKPVVLVVDDEKNTREGLGRALRRDYDVVLAESAAAALKALDERPADVMLSDVRMPGEDGLALLRQVREKHPATVCILLTAYGTVETAVEAMKLGAQNFLTKPVNLDQLDLVLERALRARDLERENRDLKRRLDARYGLENIVGSSPAMERLFDVIRQAAPTQATVLIEGASGTGKELVAQAIHHLSPRAAGPFVAVHCAALSRELLESELFGHEKGAFTGAIAQRKGRFELASGGTLFLDEIGEIDASVQVKLLRVLETRQFERVGGTETLTADIRVVAATNRDLAAEVRAGRFREDLFYRLNVVDIRMPTLAERTGDIPMLCDRFVKEFAPAWPCCRPTRGRGTSASCATPSRRWSSSRAESSSRCRTSPRTSATAPRPRRASRPSRSRPNRSRRRRSARSSRRSRRRAATAPARPTPSASAAAPCTASSPPGACPAATAARRKSPS